MSQVIELPEAVFHALNEAASARRITPVEWIADKLGLNGEQFAACPLAETLAGLVGVVDSSAAQRRGYKPGPYGAALAEKFSRQGLKTP